MKFTTAILILFSLSAMGGLPPTTLKAIGDATDLTTFKFQFPNLPVVHTGTTAVVGGGLTTTQKNAIASPTAGMQVFDSTLGQPSYYDGVAWQTGLGTLTVDTDFVNLGATTVTAVTSNPTKGTVVVDRFWAKRNGQMLEGLYQYQQSATGSAGSGEYIFSLPTGYAIDTTIITPYTGSVINTTNTALALANIGSGVMAGSAGSVTANCRLIAYSSTQYRTFCVGANGNSSATQWLVSSAQMGFTESATMSYSFNIRAPITGWSSNASTFSAASANYSFTSGGAITITATTTSPVKGTVVTDRVFYQKNGQNMKAIYQYEQSTGGTNSTGNALFLLPNSQSFDTSIVNFCTTVDASVASNNPKCVVGKGHYSNGSSNVANAWAVAYDATHFRILMHLGVEQFLGGGTGTAFSGNLGFEIDLDAPISGWSNLSQVVANISGYAQAPGLAGSATPNLDHFSFGYGGASATTVCSTGTCTKYNSIGASAASVVFGSTGNYTLNFGKTYSSVNCSITTGNGVAQAVSATPVSCSSCSSQTFSSATSSGGGAAGNAFGTIMCDGSY